MNHLLAVMIPPVALLLMRSRHRMLRFVEGPDPQLRDSRAFFYSFIERMSFLLVTFILGAGVVSLLALQANLVATCLSTAVGIAIVIRCEWRRSTDYYARLRANARDQR